MAHVTRRSALTVIAGCAAVASGRALAEEILGLEPTFDLSPYRLERFESDAIFPEELVL